MMTLIIKMRDTFYVQIFSGSLLNLAMFTIYIVCSGVRNILTARGVNSENEPQPAVERRNISIDIGFERWQWLQAYNK